MTSTEPQDLPDPEGASTSDYLETPTPPVQQTVGDQQIQGGKTVNDVVRENAFHRAQIDVTTPVGRLLLNGYAGDLEIDAIRTAAAEVGIWKAPEEPGTGDELKDRQDLANGTEPLASGPGTGPHPHEVALRAGQQVSMNGGTEEEAMAAAFTSMVIAAASGDKRGLVQQQQPAR